jgi:hypothetical protein
VAGADLGGVPPALLTLAISGNAGEVGDIDLSGQKMQDCERHGYRIFKEGSQKPSRHKLQGEAKTAAIASLICDAFPVIVIEMEVPRQFVGRQRVWITAITLPLSGGQKIDGHGASPISITKAAIVVR